MSAVHDYWQTGILRVPSSCCPCQAVVSPVSGACRTCQTELGHVLRSHLLAKHGVISQASRHVTLWVDAWRTETGAQYFATLLFLVAAAMLQVGCPPTLRMDSQFNPAIPACCDPHQRQLEGPITYTAPWNLVACSQTCARTALILSYDVCLTRRSTCQPSGFASAPPLRPRGALQTAAAPICSRCRSSVDGEPDSLTRPCMRDAAMSPRGSACLMW